MKFFADKKNLVASVIFILSLFLLYSLNHDILKLNFLNPFITGWDGAGHYFVAKYYSEHIFPSFWGWIPNVFGGMPFPQFYPPIFYYLSAIFYRISGLDFEMSFRILSIVPLFIIPFVLSLIYRKFINKDLVHSACVFLFSVLSLSMISRVNFSGVSMPAVVNNGLITQPLATMFLLLWILYFFDQKRNKVKNILSIIFLSLTILTNVHVMFVALVIYLVDYAVVLLWNKDRNWNFIFNHTKEYFINGMTTIFLVSFWYLPMLAYSDFSPARNLVVNVWGNYFFRYWYFSLCVGVVLFFAFVNKKRMLASLTVSVAILFFIITFDIPTILGLQDLPIHLDRWFGTFYVFFPFYIILTFLWIYEKVHNKKAFIFLVCVPISLVAFVSLYYSQMFSDAKRGIYLGDDRENLSEIIDSDLIDPSKGKVIVEDFSVLENGETNVMNAYLGINRKDITTLIIRESSLNSIFMVALRNMFSLRGECWSIRCLRYDDFNEFNVNERIEMARFVGVKYLLIRSNTSFKILKKSPLVEFSKDFGKWKLFVIKQNVEMVEYLGKEPVLVVGNSGFKKNNKDFLDFTSLVETQMRTSITNLHYARAKEDYLDKVNYSGFKVVFLSDYKYKNLDYVKSSIDNYMEDSSHKLILKRDSNDLFRYLNGKYGNRLLIIYPRENPVTLQNRKYVAEEIERFAPAIDLSNKNISYTYGDDFFSVQTSGEAPVVIKRSIFPGWEEIENKNLYMTNMSYILSFDSDINAHWSVPLIVRLSHLISILGIIILIII